MHHETIISGTVAAVSALGLTVGLVRRWLKSWWSHRVESKRRRFYRLP